MLLGKCVLLDIIVGIYILGILLWTCYKKNVFPFTFVFIIGVIGWYLYFVEYCCENVFLRMFARQTAQ